MERRVTSHTEEEEMNQRRRLLTLARKGDQKAVEQLFELYQVKVFSGDSLKRKKLPSFPLQKPVNVVPKGSYAPEKKEEKGTVKTILGAKKMGKSGAVKRPEAKTSPAGRKPAVKVGAQKVEKKKSGRRVVGKVASKPLKSISPARSRVPAKAKKVIKEKPHKAAPVKKAKAQKKPTKKK